MLTAEERERRAYIEGNTELAAALGGEIDDIVSRESELEHENEHLKAENDRLTGEVEKLDEELAEARAILDLA